MIIDSSDHDWNKLFHKKPVSFWVKSPFHDTLQSSNRVSCNGITESALVESFQGIQDKQEGHNLRKFQKHSIHLVYGCGDAAHIHYLQWKNCMYPQNLYCHLSAHSKTFETCKVLGLANTRWKKIDDAKFAQLSIVTSSSSSRLKSLFWRSQTEKPCALQHAWWLKYPTT